MQVPEKINHLDKSGSAKVFIRNMVLSVALLFTAHPFVFANVDSTGVKKINGNLFVIYKVDAGQGLYGLARRYKTSVPKIQQANPGIAQNLSIGQMILIPYSGKTGEIPKAENKKPSKTTVVPKPEASKEVADMSEPETDKEPIYHSVTKKETLTQIAANHKLTMVQLKTWNHSDLAKLSSGQKIIVGFKEKKAVAEKAKPDTKAKAKPISDLKSKPIKKKDLKTSETEKSVPDNGTKKTVTENGMGTWVDDGSMSDISLAMHKTAPAGTVIRLTNPMNGKVKYVKVIGLLPDTDDNKSIIIKINKRTADELGIIDKDFRVRLDYSVNDTNEQ